MNQSPLLSVIVPSFNCREYLGHCLTSILSQTYSNIEVVLVDDGSTDGSDALYEPLRQADQRLVVVKQENQGLLIARLQGLQISTGAYATFVDADDWVDPTLYEQLMAHAVNSGSDITEAQISYDYPGRSHIWTDCLPPGEYNRNSLKANLFPFMFHHPTLGYGLWRCSLANKVFRRPTLVKAYSHVADKSVFMGEDMLVSTIALLLTNKVTVVQGPPYYHYRQHANQSVRKYKSTLYRDSKSLVQNLLDVSHDVGEADVLPSLYFKYIECLKDVLAQEMIYNYQGAIRLYRFIGGLFEDQLTQDAIGYLNPKFEPQIRNSPLNWADKLVYRLILTRSRKRLLLMMLLRRASIRVKAKLRSRSSVG